MFTHVDDVFCRKEIKEGAEVLQEKIAKYKPKIAVFNGKGLFCCHTSTLNCRCYLIYFITTY